MTLWYLCWGLTFGTGAASDPSYCAETVVPAEWASDFEDQRTDLFDASAVWPASEAYDPHGSAEAYPDGGAP